MKIILDSSALLAHMEGEPGGNRLPEDAAWLMLSVNYSETLTRMERRVPHQMSEHRTFVDHFLDDVISFDTDLATLAAEIYSQTSPHGLSLGDRACLALGLQEGLPVYTTDRAWLKCDLPLEIQLLR